MYKDLVMRRNLWLCWVMVRNSLSCQLEKFIIIWSMGLWESLWSPVLSTAFGMRRTINVDDTIFHLELYRTGEMDLNTSMYILLTLSLFAADKMWPIPSNSWLWFLFHGGLESWVLSSISFFWTILLLLIYFITTT